MKKLTKILAITGIVFLTSAYAAESLATSNQISGGSCNNPKCECPKPCQCGAACKCGIKGNVADMNGTKS